LKYTLEIIKEKYPDHKLLAIGHSFGANILFKYLGLNNKDSHLVGAVSIANPFDLYLASKYIKGTVYEGYVTKVRQKNLNKFFIFFHLFSNSYLICRKKEFYVKHSEKFEIDLDKALTVKSAKEYDEFFSRRIYGYPTVDTYYREISCAPHIHNVTIPSLFIQSYDDPIIQ